MGVCVRSASRGGAVYVLLKHLLTCKAATRGLVHYLSHHEILKLFCTVLSVCSFTFKGLDATTHTEQLNTEALSNVTCHWRTRSNHMILER